MAAGPGAGDAARRQGRSWPLWRRRCGVAAGVLSAAVVGLWLFDVTRQGEEGPAVPEALSRGAIVAALAAGAAWLAAALAARLAGRRGWALGAALVLPALLALSLAVRFAGIDSEVSGRYYLDEGTYYHHATMIDRGEVLSLSFVYPHLVYYADALTLWAAARFPATVAALGRRLYGLDDPLAVAWLLLRGVVALLSALTVVPVYELARRASGGGAGAAASWVGRAAGALAAALLIASDLFNEGSHLNTCDVPSAFFATVCLLLVSRLADRERVGGYLLAGVAAGLAGASKYPAGLVALGIAAVWLGWRVRRRDWNGGLAWAALGALATFVAVMPSVVVYPGMAFAGQRGIFFGARQYGLGGWLGVMPESNAGFYAGKLLWSFGWPAVAAGLSGLALLGIRARTRGRLARLLWLAPFPVVFLALVTSMNMVVKRNLYPVLPILAVYLGAGMASWLELAAAGRMGGGAPSSSLPPSSPPWWPRSRTGWRWAAPVLALACLWQPAGLTARQTAGYVMPSTREEAGAWIGAHLPAGAAIVKESYTPDFPPGRFAVSHERFAGRIPIDELRSPENDYLLLSSAAYSRFRDPGGLFTDNQRQLASRYDEIFRTFPLVKEWIPDELQLGPVLRLYRIDPEPASCLPAADLPAADAFVSDVGLRPDPEHPERPLRFHSPGDWGLFRGCFPAGRYRIGLLGNVRLPARVRVTDVAGVQLALLAVRPAAAGGSVPAAPRPSQGVEAAAGAELSLPRSGKVLFYVYLAPGSRLRAVTLARSPPD
jgi:Dolichyl-phosphate-mannose-protein mannosyltransferase